MKWRVMVEVTGEDDAVTRHVISEGERTGAGQAATLGLSLAERKATLAGLQHVLCGLGQRRPRRSPSSATARKARGGWVLIIDYAAARRRPE